MYTIEKELLDALTSGEIPLSKVIDLRPRNSEGELFKKHEVLTYTGTSILSKMDRGAIEYIQKDSVLSDLSELKDIKYDIDARLQNNRNLLYRAVFVENPEMNTAESITFITDLFIADEPIALPRFWHEMFEDATVHYKVGCLNCTTIFFTRSCVCRFMDTVMPVIGSYTMDVPIIFKDFIALSRKLDGLKLRNHNAVMMNSLSCPTMFVMDWIPNTVHTISDTWYNMFGITMSDLTGIFEHDSIFPKVENLTSDMVVWTNSGINKFISKITKLYYQKVESELRHVYDEFTAAAKSDQVRSLSYIDSSYTDNEYDLIEYHLDDMMHNISTVSRFASIKSLNYMLDGNNRYGNTKTVRCICNHISMNFHVNINTLHDVIIDTIKDVHNNAHSALV